MNHIRAIFLYWFLFFAGLVSAFAQASVRVRVENLPQGLNHFSIVAFKDYISLTPEFLAEKTGDETAIDLEFSLHEKRWVRLTGLGLGQDFIAVPGNSYHFIFESGEENYLTHDISVLPSTDPNIPCDSVNIALNRFFYEYNTQIFSGYMAKQTATFCDSLERKYVGVPDVLFQTFLSVRLDELRLMAKALQEPNMYKQRFEGRIFQPENPDYAYAFSEFYKGRFAQALLSNKLSQGKVIINQMQGLDTLIKLFAPLNYYKGETGEAAILLGLTELLGNKTYNRDGILFFFNQFADSSKYESVKKVAGRLYKKYRMPVSGEQAPAVQVEDKTGRVLDVGTDARRRTYLCFFDPNSAVIGDELGALNDLKKSLKEDMVIVPVIINAELSELSRMQNTQKLGYELYRNTSAATLSDFRLKNDCTCMVLAPDGKFILPVAPVPTAPDANIRLTELAKTGR